MTSLPLCAKQKPIERSVVEIADQFPVFTGRILERLEMGARVYGDASFDEDPLVLLEEIQQEVLDVAGWSFILFRRIERMKQAVRQAAWADGVGAYTTQQLLDEVAVRQRCAQLVRQSAA